MISALHAHSDLARIPLRTAVATAPVGGNYRHGLVARQAPSPTPCVHFRLNLKTIPKSTRSSTYLDTQLDAVETTHLLLLPSAD